MVHAIVTEFKYMVKKNFSEVIYEVGSDETSQLKVTVGAMGGEREKKNHKLGELKVIQYG